MGGVELAASKTSGQECVSALQEPKDLHVALSDLMIARRQPVDGTHHRRLLIKRHGVKYLTKPLDVPDDPFDVLRRCVHGSRYFLFEKLLSVTSRKLLLQVGGEVVSALQAAREVVHPCRGKASFSMSPVIV